MYILIKFTCLVCSLSISRLFTLSRLAVLMSTQCRPFRGIKTASRDKVNNREIDREHTRQVNFIKK